MIRSTILVGLPESFCKLVVVVVLFVVLVCVDIGPAGSRAMGYDIRVLDGT